MTAPRVLIVDDEPYVLGAAERVLREAFKVTTCTRADAAIEALRREHFDVVVSDYLMPDMNGALLLEIAHELSPATARVLMTASHDLEELNAAAAQGGACRFIPKPFRNAQIIQAVADAAESAHRHQAHVPVVPPSPVVGEK